MIPSLGKNLNWLERAVDSIQKQKHTTTIIVVIPHDQDFENFLKKRNICYVFEKDSNLTSAINTGVQYLFDQKIDYFAFLGDDDILLPASTASLMRAFDQKNTVASVGHCWYIDEMEQVLFHNRAWPRLIFFMTILPNMLPHPGAIMRTADWHKIGKFDESLNYAMDLDFWLRLNKVGKIRRVECPMSLFRWHPGGLTASNRKDSKYEATLVRRKHAKGFMRILNKILSPIFTLLGEFVLLRRATRY